MMRITVGSRLVFSRFLDLRENLGNVKEKPLIDLPLKSDYSSVTGVLILVNLHALLHYINVSE